MNNFNRERRGDRRDNRRGSFNSDRERPQMHETICSDCGQRCEVPFKPTNKKPVYCSNCFRKESRDDGFSKFNRRPDQSPRSDFGSKRDETNLKDLFDKLIIKLDVIIDLLNKEKEEKTVKTPKKTPKKTTTKKKS